MRYVFSIRDGISVRDGISARDGIVTIVEHDSITRRPVILLYCTFILLRFYIFTI